jgi:hypothetical protein
MGRLIIVNSIIKNLTMDKKFTKNYLKAAHKASRQNKGLLSNSKVCGCFHCLRVFDPILISFWVDQPENDPQLSKLISTAMCPYCDIDSVIPDVSGFPLSKAFLYRMNIEYFVGCVCKSDYLNNKTQRIVFII